MNSHERVCCTLNHEKPDRIPIYDSFWTDTLSLWRAQGLPEEVAFEDHFDFDIRIMGIDASPRFEPRLLEEDGDIITLQDRFGYVYHSDHSVPPDVSWERYCLIMDWVRRYGSYE